ncbi:MAG: tyrosine-type recombinase/integrase [Candidatus Kerfeldbacteria bacterium]|nr:tyrosine-type recombinase/integrase [Candidatus Kerfeldbacteria bacterium]
MPASTNLNQLVEKFLVRLSAQKQLRPATVKNYRFYLNKFINWTKTQSPKLSSINELKPEHLKTYSSWLKATNSISHQKLSAATQNYYLIALRSFLKSLNQNGLKAPTYQTVALNDYQPTKDPAKESEIKATLKACQLSQENDLIKQRDYAILQLLLSAGLKVSEISKLTRDNLNPESATLDITSTKGKIRTIQLNQNTRQAINDYLRRRHDTDIGLFISHDRAQVAAKRRQCQLHSLTARSLQRITKHYCQAAGLKKKITPSTLRDFFAQTLLARGDKVEQIQTALGHTNILTTRRYTKTRT